MRKRSANVHQCFTLWQYISLSYVEQLNMEIPYFCPMNFLRFTSALCIVLILIVSCNTTTIKPPKPSNYAFVEPAKPTSGITVPIEINLASISRTLNAQYPTSFYTDDSYENNGTDNLKLSVLKRDLLHISTQNGNILIKAPMRLEGTYRINKKVLGMNVTHDQGFGFNLIINFTTLPTFDKDWNLKLNSKAQITWEDLPKFEVLGLNIDFQKVFGNIIQGRIDKLTQQIDKELSKSVDLRKLVSTQLQQLTKPFSVDATTNTWLTIKPKNVFYTPLQSQDSVAQLKLGLYSLIEIVSGKKPATDSVIVLPTLYQTNKLDEKVNLVLSTEVKFEQINTLITQQLNGKSLKLEDKQYNINVLDAKVFGNADKFLIGVKIDGKVTSGLMGKRVKGIVYFEGIPVYDATKQAITITNFNLNLQTKDVLLKSASWLANSVLFKNAIQKNLTFPIANELAKAKLQANQAINKSYGKNLTVAGNIDEIIPADIYITPDGIHVNIKATGKLGVKLNNF